MIVGVAQRIMPGWTTLVGGLPLEWEHVLSVRSQGGGVTALAGAGEVRHMALIRAACLRPGIDAVRGQTCLVVRRFEGRAGSPVGFGLPRAC
jgi:hypothetical protein